jgi:hypothetical protein
MTIDAIYENGFEAYQPLPLNEHAGAGDGGGARGAGQLLLPANHQLDSAAERISCAGSCDP